MERKKEDRSLLIYLLLSIVTCGIYGAIFMWKFVKDLNEVSAAKNKESWQSPNYIIVALLTIVTCGIYAFYWLYKIGNTIQRTGEDYGEHIDENGTTFILWSLFGTLLCAAGPFIAYHLMFENMNRICRRYNEEFIDGHVYEQGNSDGWHDVDPNEGNRAVNLKKNPSQGGYFVDMPESEEITQMQGSTIGVGNGAIICTKGSMQGAKINILDGEMVTIGRDGAASNLILPDRDISRRHCTVQFNAVENCYYVTDYSSLGTQMNGSVRLEKEMPTRCSRGTRLILGQGNNEFVLQ